MIKNYFEFKVNDVVCLKSTPDNTNYYFFDSVFGVRPMKVIGVHEDNLYEERKFGQIGGNNEYICLDLFSGTTMIKYQKELVFWSERKGDVISKIKTYLIGLENS